MMFFECYFRLFSDNGLTGTQFPSLKLLYKVPLPETNVLAPGPVQYTYRVSRIYEECFPPVVEQTPHSGLSVDILEGLSIFGTLFTKVSREP